MPDLTKFHVCTTPRLTVVKIQLARAVLAATLALTVIPSLATLADAPAAMATPYEQGPQPPQLSDEEQQAWDNQKAGRDYDKDAFKRARAKITTREKYEGERNQQKRDNNKRGGGRKR